MQVNGEAKCSAVLVRRFRNKIFFSFIVYIAEQRAKSKSLVTGYILQPETAPKCVCGLR